MEQQIEAVQGRHGCPEGHEESMKSRKYLEGQAKDILDHWSKHEVVKELLEHMTVSELDEFVSSYGD